jgi:uncharacterized protein
MMRNLISEGKRGQCMNDFWQLLGGGALHLQRCESCEFVRFPPAGACPSCGVEGGSWTELGGQGTLRAWTVTHASASDRLPSRLQADVPFVLGLVEVPRCPSFLIPVRVTGIPAPMLEVGLLVQLGLGPGERRQLVASAVTA